jgi:hypothetical protein
MRARLLNPVAAGLALAGLLARLAIAALHVPGAGHAVAAADGAPLVICTVQGARYAPPGGTLPGGTGDERPPVPPCPICLGMALAAHAIVPDASSLAAPATHSASHTVPDGAAPSSGPVRARQARAPPAAV